MERTFIAKLAEWKLRENRKPLILDGARQIGKTWLLKEFGRSCFSKTAYFNCDKNIKLKEVFSGGYDMKRILRDLGGLAGFEITASDTLIIFDEIQELPDVLTSLKYFCEDAKEFFVAAAGSLLGLSAHSGTGFPVGKVDVLHLSPMSFSEFVLARKGEGLFKILTESPSDELKNLHSVFVELLREYYFTGGMPEAVNAFVQEKPLSEIRMIQKSILYAYEKDISKHTESRETAKIHQVWESLPMQLAKENRRFVYGALRHGARAKDFENAIQWLVDAGFVFKVRRIRKAGIPLAFYEDFDAFKLFMVDLGLMGAICETPPEDILIGNSIFEEYKGAFTEQYVFQELKAVQNANDTGLQIYYFSADDSKQELDFILQHKNKIIPIEVKAEENLRAKSLRQFVHDNPQTHGARFSMSHYRGQDWMTNVPLYAVERTDFLC